MIRSNQTIERGMCVTVTELCVLCYGSGGKSLEPTDEPWAETFYGRVNVNEDGHYKGSAHAYAGAVRADCVR